YFIGRSPLITTRTGIRMILAAALLVAVACGKKDDAAPLHPALTSLGAMEKVPAQAEVKASSGPIELSLLLHKTQIKVGESLWQQLRIRNVGDKEIIVADQTFQDPRELRIQSSSRYGTYLEMTGPDGKPLKVQFLRSAERESHIMEGVSGLLEVEGPKEQAMLDGWKKEGLSTHEINVKLIDFNTKKQQAAERAQEQPVIKLLPGQSAETKSEFYYSMQDKIHNRPIPRPIGSYAQVDFFLLERPGKYTVRAVYDRLQSELAREAGLPSYPHNVLVRTPWVSVEVLP
ncbi:MAG: hypothetical protein ABL955_08330, partial [Elusimicrobiota bacterium]